MTVKEEVQLRVKIESLRKPPLDHWTHEMARSISQNQLAVARILFWLHGMMSSEEEPVQVKATWVDEKTRRQLEELREWVDRAVTGADRRSETHLAQLTRLHDEMREHQASTVRMLMERVDSSFVLLNSMVSRLELLEAVVHDKRLRQLEDQE